MDFKPSTRPEYISVTGAGEHNGTYTIEDWVDHLATNPPQGVYTVQGIWGNYQLPTHTGEKRLRLGQRTA